MVKTNLEYLMRRDGLTPYSLAAAAKANQPTIFRILSGESEDPRTKTLEPIARYFGLTVEDLRSRRLDTTREPGKPEYDAGHKNHSVRQDNAELSTTKAVKSDPLKAPIEGAIAIRMQRVPVVGTAQFGDEGYWEETQYPVGHGEGFIEFPTRDPNAYALRGSGNSMAPRFRHGEFVIIEPNTEIFPGDEVMVALTNGRKMGKIFTYERDGMTHFESVNQDHSPISVPTTDIEKMHFIAGVAKRSLWRPPV